MDLTSTSSRPGESRPRTPPRGRGTALAPPNRFEEFHVELDPDFEGEAGPEFPDEPASRGTRVKTVFFDDDSQSIISRNQSPDIGFEVSLNPYRGCEHGCAYCYARPYHEYLGFNSGIDFESKIMVKRRAPELLERELGRPRWVPTPLACSGVTDCYQPAEKELKITRACLEVLARFLHPVGFITKNHLITRDMDLLEPLASRQACSVHLSITTLDARLGHQLEPRASSPSQRLEAIRTLSAAGIPVAVNVAPVIPGLTEHEIPAILEAAADHGALAAGYTIVRLPHAVKSIFDAWLETFLPGQRDKILGRIREIRGGEKLNDTQFGTRMSGVGPLAADIRRLFEMSLKRHRLDRRLPPLSSASFLPPRGRQLELF